MHVYRPVWSQEYINHIIFQYLVKETPKKQILKMTSCVAITSGAISQTNIKVLAWNLVCVFKVRRASTYFPVVEIFEKYETSIDMITTSEIAVSLTIDDASNLSSIVEELEKFSLVEVDSNQSIICLVGHLVVRHSETHRLFKVLQDISVRMISYGGSNNNISLLVNTNDKITALKRLNSYVFEYANS